MARAQQPVAGGQTTGSAPGVPPVITEHFLELAFLAIQRRKLLFAPDVPLVSFHPHDERIAAHWDGLVVGAPLSVDIALARMEEFDPWETYAGARVWIELGGASATQVLDRIAKGDPAVHGSWGEAFRRIPRQRFAELFPATFSPPDNSPATTPIIYGLGAHDMLSDTLAASAAFKTDPVPRRAVARALGWNRSAKQAPALLATLAADPDADVRHAAIWSIALRQAGEAAAQSRNRIRAGEGDYFDCRVIGMVGNESDVKLLAPLAAAAGENRAAAIRALGDLGGPASIGTLVEIAGSTDKPAGAAAQESIGRIVGSIPGAPPPADDDEPAAAADADKLREWWATASASFAAGTRWLHGQQFPWSGARHEEPMEALWRSLFHYSRPEFDWLRNETPDGFFEPVLRNDAVPGE